MVLDSNPEIAAIGGTTIAIVYRLSTIRVTDCMYFIKVGRVGEFGTHGQLQNLRKR